MGGPSAGGQEGVRVELVGIPIFTNDQAFCRGVEVLYNLGQRRDYVPCRCHPDLGCPSQQVFEFPVCQDGKGPCPYDVRTEGGGRFKNCPILRTDKTDRLREMRTRGRGV